MQARKGTVIFEQIDPDDLPSGVNSLGGDGAQSVFVDPPGNVDHQLGWAITEIISARNAGNLPDRERHSTNAVLAARRALACLVDWYITRDCFSLCKGAPKTEKEKTGLLVRRN